MVYGTAPAEAAAQTGDRKMGRLSDLEPKAVWKYFEEICGIPHGSGNEKAISDYCVAFAGLAVIDLTVSVSMSVYFTMPSHGIIL